MKSAMLIVFLVLGLLPASRADEVAAVRQLADQGNTTAQFVLGSMYRDGRGVAQDNNEMLRWWRMAAGAGNFDAQFALGDIYSGGYGVATDHVLAYMWFDILAVRGTQSSFGEIATRNRDAVKLFMTPDAVTRAMELSTDWQSKNEM